MTEGPRKRSSSGGGCQSEAPRSQSDVGKDAGGSGVALKKQIGLVSACAIIIGMFIHLVFPSHIIMHIKLHPHFRKTTIFCIKDIIVELIIVDYVSSYYHVLLS